MMMPGSFLPGCFEIAERSRRSCSSQGSVTLPSVLGIDAPDHNALHAVPAREHGLADDERRRGDDMGDPVDLFLQRLLVLDAGAGVFHDDNVRHGGEDLVAEIALETRS